MLAFEICLSWNRSCMGLTYICALKDSPPLSSCTYLGVRYFFLRLGDSCAFPVAELKEEGAAGRVNVASSASAAWCYTDRADEALSGPSCEVRIALTFSHPNISIWKLFWAVGCRDNAVILSRIKRSCPWNRKCSCNVFLLSLRDFVFPV